MYEDALRIFDTALKAAHPYSAVRRHLEPELPDLLTARRIFVVGAGKASAVMAKAVEDLLGERISDGLVNVKYGHTEPLKRIRLHECGHPVPDNAGVEGAREISNLAASATEDDVVICVISGGASALLPFPAQPLTLEEKQQTTRLLLRSGATIHEINAVRKHISSIKGGWLAALAYPARIVSLILSDVIGNNLDVIGSGVTAPDSSTFAGAQSILRRYGIWESIPAAVRKRMEEAQTETPKADHPAFERTRNLIVGSNDLALNAAAKEAKELGYNTMVLSSFIEGETRDVAKVHAAIAKEIQAFARPLTVPACVISGGETTVTIKGEGKGGRNQEFALTASIDIAGMSDVVLLSAGTDGTDGPTDAAGAWCDGNTADSSAQTFLDRNDSYSYFERTGNLIKTGPTGTNVMDVRLVLVR